MVRLGLCCQFFSQEIKFRTTTARAVGALSRKDRLAKLAELCRHNGESLLKALTFCAGNKIGSFRVLSPILPLKTHPELGYRVEGLPGGRALRERFEECGRFAAQNNIRTTFHPDQFVVLNSPRRDVVKSSIRELEYQAEVAEWLGADVVNIHAGGMFGDKPKALKTFRTNLSRVSERVRQRLTLENDDRTYTPEDLLPLCEAEGIPFVYDIHHHRCHPDRLSDEESTRRALSTWNREPLFHISSPLEGWKGPKPNRHHDYINLRDFPVFWQRLDVTVEVEAKAKELAVERLLRDLEKRARRLGV